MFKVFNILISFAGYYNNKNVFALFFTPFILPANYQLSGGKGFQNFLLPLCWRIISIADFPPRSG